MIHNTLSYTKQRIYVQKGLDPEGLFTKGGGGGALKAKGLTQRRKQRRGKRMRGGLRGIEPPLIKILASENAFQAI